MTKFIDSTGKTEDEAVNAGLAQLGLTRDEVSVEILEMPKAGFLGMFGGTPARVRLSYEVPDPVVEEPPRPKPAPVKAAPVKAAVAQNAAAAPVKKTEPAVAPVKPEAAPAAAQEAASAKAPAEESPAREGTQRERVERYLHGLLDLMGVKAEILMTERENGGLNVELSGNGMGAVIGRRGETLDAIQHLLNYSVNRGSEKRLHISVDAENYRSKREDSLVRLAEKMAAKAIKYRRSMALEPMNSYERHVIHTALQNYEGVSTASVGEEPNRRVVVNYEKNDNRNEEGSGRPRSREWA